MMRYGKTYEIGLCGIIAVLLSLGSVSAERVWVDDGRAAVSVHVPQGLMADDASLPRDIPYPERRIEEDRRRLRESVRDLLKYVEQISGAQLPLVEGPPADDGAADRLPVLIGDLARDVFGPPAESDVYGQGWRLVVSEKGIGVWGETGLGTSYAIYEILHRWGCRWYMPGDLGACIPSAKTLTLSDKDLSATPATLFRNIWYADNDFRRRNRQGGLHLRAGHALETYISAEQRTANPEWRAIVNGTPHRSRIKWTRTDVAEAIADTILGRLEQQYLPSFSLSPEDGIGWDEEEDPAHDPGDWDDAAGVVSKTDRLLMLCNRVAERVTEHYPDVLFGMLAYVDYTRPPVREPVHPNVIPQIAPITYNRAHPMTWQNHPNEFQLLELVNGWSEVADRLSHYWYGYNLSETWSPNPFITKWGTDIPIIMENNCAFWMPETLPNFETTIIGLNLGMRLSWDAGQDPDEIVSELITRFYGAAAEPMRQYWEYIDRIWVETPEYAGCGRGHLRRFTPDIMARARELMDQSLAAAATAEEYQRVLMADESLRLFELFMSMMTDLANGKLADLETDFQRWVGGVRHLAERYRENHAFGIYGGAGARLGWINGMYGNTYRDASRIAREKIPLMRNPLRQWRYRVDETANAREQGWMALDHDDSDWDTTDSAVDTWSALGLHNYMGSMAYRITADVPAIPDGKRVTLWLAANDGSATLFVNGRHIPYRTDAGDERDSYRGYARPASFDVTEAIRPNEKNLIAFICERDGLNELGTGGLMGPVMLFRER